MKSPEETQLSDDLRHLVADPPCPVDVEAIARRGSWLRRRGFAVRGLDGVTVAGVAVAGSLALTSTASPGTSRASAARTPAARAIGPAKAETVAFVEKQIAAAALNINNYLVKARQNTSSVGIPTVEITIWTDPRTGNTMLLQGSGASRLTYWEHDYFDSHKVLQSDQTQVNYGPRTWWKYDMPGDGPVSGPVPKGPIGGHYVGSAQVKQWLDDGAGKIVGYPSVDGHHTVELSIWDGSIKVYAIFADVHTYQVVRLIKYFGPASQGPPIIADYTWVRRTPALVRLVNHPVIPAGFTEVAVGD
jgi:hypothetical protein